MMTQWKCVIGSRHGPLQAGTSPGVNSGTQPPSIFLPSPRLPAGFPGGSVVKNPPATQEMQVQSLDWEEPLEEEMATCSGILAWRIPWIEETGGLQSMGSQSQT